MIKMFKYIISYDGGQLRDSGDFEWGLFNSYGEAEEAAEYSNIGINRLTMLIKEPTCNFVLYVGNKRLIKRKLFDEFIENINMI